MRKTRSSAIPSDFKNPFLTPEREKLWEKLEKNAKPISREELIKRVEKLQSNAGK